jgi:putative dimethyl sulfoxide reductase chaperone
MSTMSADTAPGLEQRLARADLCRFLAACYYEPGPEFIEERLFDSMCTAAARLDPELARRAQRLGEAFSRHTLEELLVDYARLFIGPGPHRTHPYGSVWMNGDRSVLSLYAEGGFEIDESFRELPDHIAAELEFLYLLIYQDAPESLRQRFLLRHLGWVWPFTRAMRSGAETAFYRQLAQLTGRAVAAEASRVA